MHDINPIIEKLINGEVLTERERFKILSSKRADLEVIDYLANRFQNLEIEIFGKHSGSILELMKKGLLEGWCWQTTESSIVFLNDDDYIERGNLRFSSYRIYYHSWICFKYKNEEYVFDPGLNLLVKKDIYFKIFEVDVLGVATAKAVKEFLINCLLEYLKKNTFDKFPKLIRFEEYAAIEYSDGIRILGNDDVNSPMYRNDTKYNAVISQDTIEKLTCTLY